MSKGVLVDIPRCIGCRSCDVACKTWNELPENTTEKTNNWGSKFRLSAYEWTHVTQNLVTKDNEAKWRFVKRQCMHCLDPACASACFTASFQQTDEGAVIYKPTERNFDICVGCRYCMIACPFSVPGYQWNTALGFIQKCRFCNDRMEDGGKIPACVTACPTGALKFGELDSLLLEAKQRINNNPNYVKEVYGEKEYGGTSWIYISDTPFEEIGFRTGVSEKSIPSLTWEVLKWTPVIFVGWGATLTALKFYTKKKDADHEHDDMYEIVNTLESEEKNE